MLPCLAGKRHTQALHLRCSQDCDHGGWCVQDTPSSAAYCAGCAEGWTGEFCGTVRNARQPPVQSQMPTASSASSAELCVMAWLCLPQVDDPLEVLIVGCAVAVMGLLLAALITVVLKYAWLPIAARGPLSLICSYAGGTIWVYSAVAQVSGPCPQQYQRTLSPCLSMAAWFGLKVCGARRDSARLGRLMLNHTIRIAATKLLLSVNDRRDDGL